MSVTTTIGCTTKSFLILFATCLFAAPFKAGAQVDEIIKIRTADNMLLLGVDKNDKLLQLSYGEVVSDADIKVLPSLSMQEVYPGFGVDVLTAAIRVTHADGNMTTDLIYKSHSSSQIDANTVLTKVLLKDRYFPFEVTLFYKVFISENIIEQWAEVVHNEKKAITLYEVASSGISIDERGYYLNYFNGNWANEFNMYEISLQPGKMVLESREGVRTTQKTNPSFMLSLNDKMKEDSGTVIGGSLAWPGNWQIGFTVNDTQKLTIQAGINPYASNYVLAPAQVFKTPSFIYTYTTKGSGEITRRFHKWARKYGIKKGTGDRDVLINNWETTGMDFDEQKLSGLIKQGGDLGFDIFLLDDGWFGNKYPRNDDKAGLGDWEVNKKKLPRGLNYLINESKKNNMKFGLWVEPEMVNPKSELYERHPDWVLNAPHRAPDLQRNQLILDLANPQVQQHIVAMLEKILSENKGISYLKWDCNRYLTNAWSTYLDKDKQANLYVDYANGYLKVLKDLRSKFPDVDMMLCASGGGRMDYGSLPYFDEYWPSDNTNAHDRVLIQWGMNHFFPSVGFAAHVSEMGTKESLKFKFDVAMAGKLGMDMQPGNLDKGEMDFAKNAIKTYKNIKHVVLQGDLYRILSPYQSNRASLMYVAESKQEAVVFTYQMKKVYGGDHSRMLLKGLDPDLNYTLSELNKGSYSRMDGYEGKSFSGRYLMDQGLGFAMWDANESNIIYLRVK
jgi:alpha-galactosidase